MITLSLKFAFLGGFIALALFAILIFIILNKTEENNQMILSLRRLKNAFNELDEQAKIILKTDLELNQSQEESDKRLNGLDALQKISRQISTTLDENEIFKRLNDAIVSDLDFEYVFIAIYDKERVLHASVNHGFPQETVLSIISNITKDDSLIEALENGHAFSSVNAPTQRKQDILHIFGAEQFVLSPILSQHGMLGMMYVGNKSGVSAITEGDEEILSILASQIGQSLENARLSEEVYKSNQHLELEIKDRTKQLATALETVQEISKKKSEFISAVSHELRTPLTSIKGYAAILIAGKIGEVPDAVKERLAKINTHSDNLVALINNLLDIARIESGRVELKFSLHPVKSVVDNVADLLTPQIKEKNIKLNL